MKKDILKVLYSEDALEYKDFLLSKLPILGELDIEQNNPHHIYTVITHSLYVVNNIPNTASTPVKLAGLFHDLGKASMKTVNKDGTYSFKGHPKASTELTSEILKSIGWNKKERIQTELLVSIHEHNWNYNFKTKHMKKFLRKLEDAGLKFEDYFMLRKADILSQSTFNREDKLTLLDIVKKLADTTSVNNPLVIEYDFSRLKKEYPNLSKDEENQIKNMLKHIVERNPDHNEKSILEKKVEGYYNHVIKNGGNK